MQRKVVLTLALVLCLATSVQAALSIVNFDHSYPLGTGIVAIDIQITGADPVANASMNIEIADLSFIAGIGNFPTGGTPTISFLGNTASSGSPLTTNPTATGDYAGNFMSTTGRSLVPGNGDDSWNSDNGEATNPAVNIPASTNGGRLMTLLVDFTGFNTAAGTWRIIMDASNGNGATAFGNVANQIVPVNLEQANFLVKIVPEPTSVVLGLIGVVGLGIVAIRKRRARRA